VKLWVMISTFFPINSAGVAPIGFCGFLNDIDHLAAIYRISHIAPADRMPIIWLYADRFIAAKKVCVWSWRTTNAAAWPYSPA